MNSPSGGGSGHNDSGAGEQLEFRLNLENFSGPFDALLRLIDKKKLDVTEVALVEVTDEFMSFVSSLDHYEGLDRTTEFVVIAATLLQLKTARLLPGEEDPELAEDLLLSRDLLFARLLQFRAFKKAAEFIAECEKLAQPRFDPDIVTPQPHSPDPTGQIGVDAQQLAGIAALALSSQRPTSVSLTHLHTPQVSVDAQSEWVMSQLQTAAENLPESEQHVGSDGVRWFSFTGLCTPTTGEVEQYPLDTSADARLHAMVHRLLFVSRFLAILDLYRHRRIHIKLVSQRTADELNPERIITLITASPSQ